MSNLTKFFDFRFSKKAKYVILGIMIFDQLVQQPKLEEHMENMTSLNIARTNISRHLGKTSMKKNVFFWALPE